MITNPTLKTPNMQNYPIIGLSVGNAYKFYYPEDILYCQSEGNYTKVFFNNGKSTTTAKKLKDLELILPESIFVRVHHSYIINLMYVSKFHNEDVKEIEMKSGDRISVSRRKKSVFLSKFLKL